MRYKQAVDKKLDQLENMLIGFSSKFSDPNFTVVVAKDMISMMKDKIEEIRNLVNNEPQD